MKKILYLIDNNIDTIGGSQKSVKTTIEQMLSLKYNIGIFMPIHNDYPSCSFKNNCSIYYYKKSYNSKIIKLLKNMKELIHTIKTFKPEIIHAQNPRVFMILGFISWFGFFRNIKKIYTDRGFFTSYKRSKQFIYRLVSKRYNMIITTTELNKKEWQLKAHYNNISVVPNVLDDQWFNYSLKEEKQIKKKENVDGLFNIGFVGRFVPIKRWDTVYDICSYLKDDNGIHFSFSFAYDNVSQKNEMLKYISNIKKLLGNKVKISVQLNEEQIKKFYYSLDAYIITSDGESFGRTIIEAMTKRNLVFGTDTGGIPSVIKENKFLFSVGDYKAVSEKIKYYMKNSLETQKYKDYFLQYAKDNYTVDILRKKMNKIYKQL